MGVPIKVLSVPSFKVKMKSSLVTSVMVPDADMSNQIYSIPSKSDTSFPPVFVKGTTKLAVAPFECASVIYVKNADGICADTAAGVGEGVTTSVGVGVSVGVGEGEAVGVLVGTGVAAGVVSCVTIGSLTSTVSDVGVITLLLSPKIYFCTSKYHAQNERTRIDAISKNKRSPLWLFASFFFSGLLSAEWTGAVVFEDGAVFGAFAGTFLSGTVGAALPVC